MLEKLHIQLKIKTNKTSYQDFHDKKCKYSGSVGTAIDMKRFSPENNFKLY